jgi:hypothetical protein
MHRIVTRASDGLVVLNHIFVHSGFSRSRKPLEFDFLVQPRKQVLLIDVPSVI